MDLTWGPNATLFLFITVPPLIAWYIDEKRHERRQRRALAPRPDAVCSEEDEPTWVA